MPIGPHFLENLLVAMNSRGRNFLLFPCQDDAAHPDRRSDVRQAWTTCPVLRAQKNHPLS